MYVIGYKSTKTITAHNFFLSINIVEINMFYIFPCSRCRLDKMKTKLGIYVWLECTVLCFFSQVLLVYLTFCYIVADL